MVGCISKDPSSFSSADLALAAAFFFGAEDSDAPPRLPIGSKALKKTQAD